MALDFKCEKIMKLKSIEKSKEVLFEESLCYNHPLYDFISTSCINNKECEALKAYRIRSDSFPSVNGYGNPLHLKCQYLGGEPRFVELWINQVWRKTALCRFDDGSFISVFNRI